jgi:hypothetical protein
LDQIIDKKKTSSDVLTPAIIIVDLRGKQTGIEGGGQGFYFVESIRDTTKCGNTSLKKEPVSAQEPLNDCE